MSFKIREKVVCVDNEPNRDFILARLIGLNVVQLVKDEIYTVRGLTKDGGVLLVEVINPAAPGHPHPYERGYAPWRFRKIDYSFGEELCSSLEENVKTVEMV
jgi:hypothetical protein